MNKTISVLMILGAGVLTFLLVVFITFQIVCSIEPPYFDDPDTGERYHVMATGQLFTSVFVALVLSIFSMVITYRKLFK